MISKDAGRQCLTHHYKGDEIKWMRRVWRNCALKFVAEKTRELRGKPTHTRFRSPRNPHGVTDTRTRDPSAAVGGQRLTVCTMEPRKIIVHVLKLLQNFVNILLQKLMHPQSTLPTRSTASKPSIAWSVCTLHVQLCSKRMGRLVVVTNVSFYERITRVNSMPSKTMQRWDVCSDWFFDSHRSTRQSQLQGGIAKW